MQSQRSAGNGRHRDLLRDLGLRAEDIIEKFIRSRGRGGQKVNKTATCVYLKHLPTGIEVKCQQERTQARNREAAFRLLASKVDKAFEQERMRKVSELEKALRRKRQRPAALRERILEAKHRTAEKKKLRMKRYRE
jgi:protein subunit release factor B